MTSESAEFVYKCTDIYNPSAEKSILWNDSELKINWPLVKNQVSLSAKDENAEKLSQSICL